MDNNVTLECKKKKTTKKTTTKNKDKNTTLSEQLQK